MYRAMNVFFLFLLIFMGYSFPFDLLNIDRCIFIRFKTNSYKSSISRVMLAEDTNAT